MSKENCVLFGLEQTEKMQQLAAKRARMGCPLDEFVVLCIDVRDQTWRALVNKLAPGFDWDTARKQGLEEVVRATVMRRGIETYLTKIRPEIKDDFQKPLPENHVRAVILAEGEANLCFITPVKPFSSH